MLYCQALRQVEAIRFSPADARLSRRSTPKDRKGWEGMAGAMPFFCRLNDGS